MPPPTALGQILVARRFAFPPIGGHLVYISIEAYQPKFIRKFLLDDAISVSSPCCIFCRTLNALHMCVEIHSEVCSETKRSNYLSQFDNLVEGLGDECQPAVEVCTRQENGSSSWLKEHKLL